MEKLVGYFFIFYSLFLTYTINCHGLYSILNRIPMDAVLYLSDTYYFGPSLVCCNY